MVLLKTLEAWLRYAAAIDFGDVLAETGLWARGYTVYKQEHGHVSIKFSPILSDVN